MIILYRFNYIFLLIGFSFFLSSCQSDVYRTKNVYRKLSCDDPCNNHYKGHYKVGSSYVMKKKIYTPQEVTRYNKVGVASWYGSRYGFHGSKTANGDIYDKNLLTAAHRTLQLPSLARVKNLENGKSIIVLVNDRGPYAHNREIDLSERAATILDIKKKGTAKVQVQYLHSESQKFLKTLGLQKKSGSIARSALANSDCSVNCHIKLVNLKYKNRL